MMRTVIIVTDPENGGRSADVLSTEGTVLGRLTVTGGKDITRPDGTTYVGHWTWQVEYLTGEVLREGTATSDVTLTSDPNNPNGKGWRIQDADGTLVGSGTF